MKNHAKSSILALCIGAAAAGLIGCNGGGEPAKDASGKTVKSGTGATLTAAAKKAFDDALALMMKHDAANDWTDESCNTTSDAFKKAADEQGGGKDTFYEALYNSGVAHQRCKHDAEAETIFKGIIDKFPKYHRARVQVALYGYNKNGDIEGAIGELKQAIADAEFKNEEALVNLAILQMKRDGGSGDEGCDNDYACAKLNLQRALAINDGFMPAFNQLAVFYLQSAKKAVAKKREKSTVKKTAPRGRMKAAATEASDKKADSQALELAALVVSQALRKNPRYAPVHNTSGLISAELGDLSAAAQSFGTARQLDPKFFEAHMNYAAVNMQFRGFKQAEEAYRKALSLKPKDFEATLGLALAVRAQINDSNFDKAVKESERLLVEAKGISPDRPETYFNLAILTEEYKARQGGPKAEPILLEAKSLYDQFRQKAGSEAKYAEHVERAKGRMEDIDQKIKFAKMAAEEQKKMELLMKAEEAKKAAGEAGPAPGQ